MGSLVHNACVWAGRVHNKSIYLFKQNDNFYYAESDAQELDGAEIDERMAQWFNLNKCEHYAILRGYKEYMLIIEVRE